MERVDNGQNRHPAGAPAAETPLGHRLVDEKDIEEIHQLHDRLLQLHDNFGYLPDFKPGHLDEEEGEPDRSELGGF